MSEKYNFLTAEQSALLDILSGALFGKAKPFAYDGCSLDKLWYEAYIQTVLLVSFNEITPDIFGHEKKAYIKKKLNDDFQKNIIVDNAHIMLNGMLKKAGVQYVILKGLAAASYYPDMLMRSMGDVDFLIKSEDIDEVDRILTENGFSARKKSNSHHITYDSSVARLELHFEPPGIPDSETGEIIRGYFNDVFSSSRNILTELGEITVPSVFHHGLIILLHNVHHLTGDGLGLRHLCDWAVFINSMPRDEFYCIFEEKLKKAGLWQFALLLSRTSRKFLGCPTEIGSEIKDTELCDGLISDIFSSGNFGQKNEDRGHESLLLSGESEQGSKLVSMLSSAFRSANSIVYSNWNFVRKVRILLPVGWLFFGCRYVFRSLKGQRPKIRLKNIIDEAGKRQEFYLKLKLFESEQNNDGI